MKKVLFVLHSANYYSGATRSMTDIIIQLHSQNKVEATVLVPERTGSAVNLLNEYGIKVLYFPFESLMQDERSPLWKRTLKIPLYMKRYMSQKRLAKDCANQFKDMNVVYSNTSTILFGAMIAEYLKLPHIWHFREFRHEDHRIHLFLGEKWHMAYASHHADCFIMISKSMAEKHELCLPKAKIKQVYNEVAPNYIILRERYNVDQPLQLLIAGDVKPGKGQLDAVEAVAQLKQMGITTYLSIAGKCSDAEYKRKIETTIAQHEISENVRFLGMVQDMNSLRAQMDVGIVASSQEAFGRVTIEGMLAHLCMVGCQSGGTKELIKDSITGLFYDSGNIAELVRCLMRLHTDRELMRSISEAGFRYAEQEFTMGACSNEVYRTILKVAE